MPSKQTNLSTFFGNATAKPKPKGPKQKKVTSFFSGGSNKTKTTKKNESSSSSKSNEKAKELSKKESSDTEIEAESSTTQKQVTKTSKKSNTESSKTKAKAKSNDDPKKTPQKKQKSEKKTKKGSIKRKAKSSTQLCDSSDDEFEEKDTLSSKNNNNKKKAKIIDDSSDDESDHNDEKSNVKEKGETSNEAENVEMLDKAEEESFVDEDKNGDKGEDGDVDMLDEAEEESFVDEDKDDDEEDDESDEDEEDDKPIIKKTSKSKKKKSSQMKKKETKKSKLSTSPSKKNSPSSKSPDAIPLKEGEDTPYAALCEAFKKIEETTKRLEITDILTELLKDIVRAKQDDFLFAIYLASNTVAPAYDCVELGIGDSLLIKAIGESSGTQVAAIKKKYEKVGDLGTVALEAKGKQRTLLFASKPRPLLMKEVLNVFRQIATTTGSKSQKWKVDQIKGLLARAKGIEAKFVIRGLQGKLRIGLAQSTVLVCLAKALFAFQYDGDEKYTVGKEEMKQILEDENFSKDAQNVCNPKSSKESREESAIAIIKKIYTEVSSFDNLVNAALEVPLCKLHESCGFQPGIPVSPMLAKPTKSIQEVLQRLTGARFTCEYKYDGERAQVHMDSEGKTKVFSRSLLDTSEKYPEVSAYVKEAYIAASEKSKSDSEAEKGESVLESFVLDTEVVAFNRETKQFVPFQILSTRKKTEESTESAKVQVIVQAFDLMYLNGESLLDKTLGERRDLLHKYFAPVDGKFQFAKYADHKEDGDTNILEEFLDNAVKNQCEGLMVKTLDGENSVYEPSRRSLNWLKLKKDYLEGLGDSVDLVPLGAFHGKGKRTGVYGAYLLACYDPDTEEFQSVCKIGTGFSDEDLKSLSESLNKSKRDTKPSQYNVSDSLKCDVWFEAVQVWEVKAADLSKSSLHKGAVDKTGEAGRGIGLRFPRFERLRDDKKPDDATTSDQILEMYYAQDSIVKTGRGGDDDGI